MAAQGYYHCAIKSVGRAKGRSIVAAAAYRAGSRLTDQRSGIVYDFSRRGGVLESFIVAPENAPAWVVDRGQLWSRAEAAETRVNGRLATEFELALPHELSADQRRQLAVNFAQRLVDRYGVAVDVALHKPGQGGDHRNFHAHMLASHRQIGPEGFGEIANPHTIERMVKGRMKQVNVAGIANKDDIEPLRREWADAVNRAYEDAGLDIRVDHRSHKDRGIDAEPTYHLGPSASGMERRGEASEIGDKNREVAERNAGRQALREEGERISAEIYNLDEERAKHVRRLTRAGMVAQQTDALDRFRENSAKLEARRQESDTQPGAEAAKNDDKAANDERVRRVLGQLQRKGGRDDDRGPSR